MLNGDGNENNWSTKQKKRKHSARAAHFSVHFSAVVVVRLQL